MVRPIAVAVVATDPLMGECVTALMASQPRLRIVGAECCAQADVILVLAGAVTRAVLELMRRASQGSRPVTLVADGIADDQLRQAIDTGLISVLRRGEVGITAVVEAVVAAGSGQVQLADRYAPTDCGGTSVAFSERELHVLGLLAGGWDTGEIAVRLNYSERTVKNIIRGMLERLGLRNRTQAVAHALRLGVL